MLPAMPLIPMMNNPRPATTEMKALIFMVLLQTLGAAIPAHARRSSRPLGSVGGCRSSSRCPIGVAGKERDLSRLLDGLRESEALRSPSSLTQCNIAHDDLMTTSPRRRTRLRARNLTSIKVSRRRFGDPALVLSRRHNDDDRNSDLGQRDYRSLHRSRADALVGRAADAGRASGLAPPRHAEAHRPPSREPTGRGLRMRRLGAPPFLRARNREGQVVPLRLAAMVLALRPAHVDFADWCARRR
jgi:hypothetical protein